MRKFANRGFAMRMSAVLFGAGALLALTPAFAALPGDAERYQACLATAGREPAAAIPEATKWLGAGGGIPARHCLALAYLAQKQFGPAALALEAAARAADAAKDPHAAELWGQAGNASLAGDNAERARGYFTTALATVTAPEGRAELLIDRARALVDLKRDPEARADLDAAVKLDPQEPYGWLLRATLARRDGDLTSAEANILEAARRAPDDPDIALEAGNIASQQGKTDLARQAWTAAAAAAPPGSPTGIAAVHALGANPGSPAIQAKPAAAK